MKLLAVILIFMIAAQPVGAGFCAMESPGESADHAEMLHHGPGQEVNSPGGHDCCDTDRGSDAEPSPDCGHSLDCGFCATGMTGVTVVPSLAAARLPGYRSVAGPGTLVSRHTSPPFRPPISAS